MDLSLTAEEQAFVAEAEAWLAANYQPPPPDLDPEEELAWGRAWQRRLAEARWVGIDWPHEYGGRGLTPLHAALFTLVYARSGAPQPVNRVGLSHAGPTILTHGTDAQKRRFLPAILTAEEIWCQLFSEPGAGSDLAAVATRAEPTADGFEVTGQKVWSSYATVARWGLALVRSDPDAPRHRGLTVLAIDMQAPGVEVRPVRQLTGEAEFCEVFLDRVPVPAEHVIGAPGDGWRVAATTLAYERGVNFPLKEQIVLEGAFRALAAAAEERWRDPRWAEELADAYSRVRVLGWHNLRTVTRLAQGATPGPEASIVKLHWTDTTSALHRLWLHLRPWDPEVQRRWLWSLASSIAGGTSEIQRTIIGERLLGLPRS